MMRIDILTLFPKQADDFLHYSIMGRARQENLVEIVCTDIREFSRDKHKKVDDKPFGGGPGMVLCPQPVFDAVEAVEKHDPRPAKRILLCPQGKPLNQQLVRELSQYPRLLIISGHYEGYDERIRVGLNPMEISIGDYVLSGGESAAMVLVDSVVRLLPGVLGDETSLNEESFSRGLLEYPHYTRPREFRGMPVPEVLFSGDHAKIEKWRMGQAMERTKNRRPDLLDNKNENC
jgi:tRNA (guanine37-N1)-methyltransferase